MFAEVILNNNSKALNKIFEYEVPKELEEKIHIGSRVFVPFGRMKKPEDGFVIGFKDTSDYDAKKIISVEGEFISENRLELAKLMANKYFCNLSECIKLMLPPGTSSKELETRMKEKTGSFIYLAKSPNEIEDLIENKKIKRENHIEILRFLYENQGIFVKDLEEEVGCSKAVLQTLEKNGYIEFRKERLNRNPFINKNVKKDEDKVLTDEQQVCFDGINSDIQNNIFSNNLIYGITGSRKN